jgi:glucose-1-phosphate adenylyltransferase
MDYAAMLEYHRAKGAEVTVAVKPVTREDASRFGLLRLDADGRIGDFVEKPKTREALRGFEVGQDPAKPYLGSMGIYIFRTSVLEELLTSNHDDFGGDVLPAAIHTHRVYGYPFGGYWEDIGTIRAFFEANLALTLPSPAFHFHDTLRPIYTRPRFLPGSRIYDVVLDRALLSDGCFVEGAEIRHTVIGVRSIIGENVQIHDTVLMGADYYEGEAPDVPEGTPPMGIGRGARIRGAIIDKNARIGQGVTIEPFPRGTELDREEWSVRDGIVVVAKNAVIPPETRLGP